LISISFSCHMHISKYYLLKRLLHFGVYFLLELEGSGALRAVTAARVTARLRFWDCGGETTEVLELGSCRGEITLYFTLHSKAAEPHIPFIKPYHPPHSYHHCQGNTNSLHPMPTACVPVAHQPTSHPPTNSSQGRGECHYPYFTKCDHAWSSFIHIVYLALTPFGPPHPDFSIHTAAMPWLVFPSTIFTSCLWGFNY